MGYGKDVEGRCIFVVKFFGLGNGLDAQKISDSRFFSVDLRVQLDFGVERLLVVELGGTKRKK